MNKYITVLFLLSLLPVSGCGSKYKIYAIQENDMLRVPVAEAKIEWDDTDDIPGDLFYTNKPGWFITDEILQKVYDAEAQENLSPTLWDRLWKWLGL